MSVSVIIPTLAGSDYETTIDSLCGQVDEIVVIESGEVDGSTPIRLSPNEYQLHRVQSRLSFGEATALGISRASGDSLLLINDDAIARPGAVAQLEALHSPLGKPIVGSRNIDFDGKLVHAGGAFSGQGMPVHMPVGHKEPSLDPEDTYHAYWVTFAAVMISRWVWDKLEGFDRTYHNGYEDVDFCLRAWRAGVPVWYNGGAVFEHEGSRTLKHLEVDAHQVRNWSIFQACWVVSGELRKVLQQANKTVVVEKVS